MKSIIISIRPEWVAKILKGEKTIELRKTAPKCDLPIDVYIYCTKGDYIGHLSNKYVGKVVAKFTLNKADYDARGKYDFFTGYNSEDPETGRCEAIYDFVKKEVLKAACVSEDDYKDYACKGRGDLYLWHIEDLEIFDKPKELSDFGWYCNAEYCNGAGEWVRGKKFIPLQRAPQSWCYAKENKQ